MLKRCFSFCLRTCEQKRHLIVDCVPYESGHPVCSRLNSSNCLQMFGFRESLHKNKVTHIARDEWETPDRLVAKKEKKSISWCQQQLFKLGSHPKHTTYNTTMNQRLKTSSASEYRLSALVRGRGWMFAERWYLSLSNASRSMASSANFWYSG